ncbi:putative RNA-binding Zn ribbon-like protein [Cryobacterium mesophilum]|uniref:Zf-CGNR multi-domain protein n=1 Tax=Terrimesophilobacter mesophilus TaxID=433647 RepID=A0A4R8VD19_9MICO|nr:CGNR zinc finger domain-containing protein [Terrimesophilobacter mesophilus]MBB5632956.1 putative RNA-binding Zn ribbon-like protein [Terrimesophilobacter mesophilus]TFB79727.1 zf-CGNR multi-domain protein [Terrimesophilobacter mesophilus]
METATGQWLEPVDGVRWWFDAGALALDFAWTGAVNGEHRETLYAPADLGAWLLERFPRADSSIGERELSDALMLRAAIVGLASGAIAGEQAAASDVDIVNLFAATPDIPPVLARGSRQAGAGAVRATQALSAIARDAVRIFAAEAGGRIRECAAEDCRYLYLDTSRSGNRRWCSMQRCGNRAKVRAHRSRTATRTA